MNCEQTVIVSALVDGELTEREIEFITGHLESCRVCRDARVEYEQLRREIRAEAVEQYVMNESRTPSGWLGVHAMRLAAGVTAAAILVTLGIFLFRPDGDDGAQQMIRRSAGRPNEASLARFDGGGKAEIFKETRK